MASKNTTIIIGRLVGDPEMEPIYHPNDTHCVHYTLANSFFDKGKEVTQVHKIVSVGKQADNVMKWIHDGDLCCIEGRRDHDAECVLANRVTLLSKKAC